MHSALCWLSCQELNLLYKTTPDLQRLSTGVILTVVNRQLIADDWRVHAAVNGAQAVRDVVVPVQSQVRGVETCPLSRAQVDLQGDHRRAAVNRHVWIVFKREWWEFLL